MSVRLVFALAFLTLRPISTVSIWIRVMNLVPPKFRPENLMFGDSEVGEGS